MKHAYLILAHTEFQLLQLLVKAIDDSRNDIYIHFDKKVKTIPSVATQQAGLRILQNRVDVRWGDYSVVEAEFALFEEAVKNGPYAYYHLLSGVDLPLKGQDYIHEFFKANSGKEFIGYTLTTITPEVIRKVQRWHLFPKEFRNASLIKRVLRSGWLRVQELLHLKRNKQVEFKKGSQWVSVTHQMAHYFLEHKEWANGIFHHTFCSDEMVFQTLCWSSPYKENIFNTIEDGKGCMRAIGWKDGELKDWSEKDYEQLAQSDALFARKFNSTDLHFINRVLLLSSTNG